MVEQIKSHPGMRICALEKLNYANEGMPFEPGRERIGFEEREAHAASRLSGTISKSGVSQVKNAFERGLAFKGSYSGASAFLTHCT